MAVVVAAIEIFVPLIFKLTYIVCYRYECNLIALIA